jgi:short-subunit dehydrogenase
MNAVITGASKGIGKAIAMAFAQKGINVFLSSRSEGDLDKVKQDLLRINSEIKVFYKAGDISIKNEVIILAKSVLSVFRNIDIVVNNAGLFLPGKISDEEEGQLEMHLNTNLLGAYHLTRALLPSMLSRRSGHIINMCSIASIGAYPSGSAYCISKHAMYAFSKCLREELKPSGIRVSAILPGATLTDSWSGSGLPTDRFVEVEDIAKAVVCAVDMSPSAVLEDIIIRPQLGDI